MVGMAVLVLLIPGVQCLLTNWSIGSLETSIAATKQENENLLREIETLNTTKSAGIAEAARTLGQLEGRLERNKDLLAKTEDAQQKLEKVKALTEEFKQISRELDKIRQRFPEIMSGL